MYSFYSLLDGAERKFLILKKTMDQKMDGATPEKIIKHVRGCSSAALSYFLNNEVPIEPNKVI